MSKRKRLSVILLGLTALIIGGLLTPTSQSLAAEPVAPASAQAPSGTPVTGSAFHTYEQGTVASATGADGAATTRIRLAEHASVDPSWRTLQFVGTADIQVTIFAYNASGAYLAPSTGFQKLTSPYTYTIPQGTATITYVIAYVSGATITPADRDDWLTITASTDPGNASPPAFDPPSPVRLVPTTDPSYTTFEQGTIDSAAGTERNGASDVATRIRLAQPVPLDPSWKYLQFDGGENGYQLNVIVFAYDAEGHFLSPNTGWKALGHPYSYAIPAGAAWLDYAISYGDNGTINLNDRSTWVTITDAQAPSAHPYQLTRQTMTPEFTIPGFEDQQGANFVDGNLWVAAESDDGGAVANGNVRIYSVDYADRTSKLIHKFSHNFGHLNSFSYDPASDQLMFGNGSGSYTQAPEFYVLKVSNLDLDGTNTLASAHAESFDVPASFGAKCNVIWTSTPNVAVMLTNDGTDIRTVRLATGSTQGAYGTYHPAVAGQYNGTFDVLHHYYIDTAYDVVQSASWVQGHLVIGLGHGPKAVAVIDLRDDGTMTYHIVNDPDQAQFFEGVFYDEAHHYFGGINAKAGDGYGLASFWHDTNFTFTSTVKVDTALTPAGTVPATLSLTLGAPANFGSFIPGVEKTYTASTTASVTSTAGDAALSVNDPGHLMNGTFSLAQPLQVSGAPRSWSAPVSNDRFALGFSQAIGANDALRTGTYATTLTFTLSTTTP